LGCTLGAVGVATRRIEGRERLVAGDPLRGLAALGVLTVHAGAAAIFATGNEEFFTVAIGGGYLEAYGTVVGSLLRAGSAGFLLFFVLSGYLIGGPFVRAAIDRRRGPSVVAYARNRVLRIVPAYWTVLTLLLVVVVWLAGEATISAGDAVALFAFDISADNPLSWWIAQAWTLEVEAKFYVAMPLAALLAMPILRRLPTARARAMAIALPCLAWFCTAPFLYDDMVDGKSFLFSLRMLAAGVALAALEPILRGPRLAAAARTWMKVATAVFGGAVLYVLLAAGLAYQLGAPFDADLGRLMLDLAITGVLAAALLRQWAGGRCWRLLDNAALHWLGTRSYSFYLVHLAILTELSSVIAKTGYGYKGTLVLLLPAAIVATGLVAEVLYRIVEWPFLDYKRRRDSTVEPQPQVPAREPAPDLA
jgi:peptidoglycan/LPS O-acetylase OafA/YrhL